MYNSKKPFLTSDCGELAGILNIENKHKILCIEGDTKPEYSAAYHKACHILSDGDDIVTMESADILIGGHFLKLGEDNTWRYEMYGKKQGQTFNDAHAYLFK